MPRSPRSSPARRQPGEVAGPARRSPAKRPANAGKPAKAGTAADVDQAAKQRVGKQAQPTKQRLGKPAKPTKPRVAPAGDTPSSKPRQARPANAGDPTGQAVRDHAGDAPGRIPLWVDLRGVPTRHRIPFLRAAQRVDAAAVLVGPDDPEAGRPGIVVVDGEALLQDGRRIGSLVAMDGAAAQQAAREAEGLVLVEGGDWTIIPLENLIAAREDRPGSLYALARSPEQAGVFRDTLEHGVHGVAIAPETAADIEAAHALLLAKGIPARRRRAGKMEGDAPSKTTPGNAGNSRGKARGRKASPGTSSSGRLELVAARITSVTDAGPGDRVCVDATSAFVDGEGLLIGSTARSFVLVHAETIETEFVAARPFRVNAGALHSYVLLGDTTRYLSELRAGDHVMAVGRDGATRALTVGRAKLERRPHLLIQWTSDRSQGSAVLQNAETIRLVQPGGRPISVTQLKPGDEVLVHHEDAARHFGMPVDEMLEER